MAKYEIVMTTAGKKGEAEAIAEAIIRQRLAGCVQIIGPIASSFRWNGKFSKGREWLLMVKAPSKNYRRIEKAIKKIHSYKLPEIIRIGIAGGSSAYLNWLSESTKD